MPHFAAITLTVVVMLSFSDLFFAGYAWYRAWCARYRAWCARYRTPDIDDYFNVFGPPTDVRLSTAIIMF